MKAADIKGFDCTRFLILYDTLLSLNLVKRPKSQREKKVFKLDNFLPQFRKFRGSQTQEGGVGQSDTGRGCGLRSNVILMIICKE